MLRDLFVFLWAEVRGARRNLVVLVVGFVLLPGLLMVGTIGFDQTLPEDVPIGVAPASSATTTDDLTVARGGVAVLGTPREYESREAAIRALDREEVYLVVVVPADVLGDSDEAVVEMISHGSTVPLADATGFLVAFLQNQLRNIGSTSITIDHHQRGSTYTLSEYLVPVGTTLFVLVLGLLYVPYNIRSDRQVLDRIRHQSHLEVYIGAKLLFYTALMGLVLGAIAIANLSLGYRIHPLSPATMVATGLLFLSTAAIASGIVFLTRLARVGLFVNLAVLIGIIGFGALLYPVGFFSPLRMEIARLLPPHYLAIILRGHLLRGDPMTLYADWYRQLIVYTIGMLGFCWIGIRSYEWRA